MGDIRRRAVHGLKPGDTFTVTRTFTQDELTRFGDLTRDANPVHYDRAFAASRGFDRLIQHGLLTGSMICEIGGQLACLARAMSFEFLGPVYPGDTVTCTMTIDDLDDRGRAAATAVYVNQDGTTVLRAALDGVMPTDSDSEMLEKLLG